MKMHYTNETELNWMSVLAWNNAATDTPKVKKVWDMDNF